MLDMHVMAENKPFEQMVKPIKSTATAMKQTPL